jgi:hypothetical protein
MFVTALPQLISAPKAETKNDANAEAQRKRGFISPA